MLKKLLIGAVLVAIGYGLALVLPPPESLQNSVQEESQRLSQEVEDSLASSSQAISAVATDASGEVGALTGDNNNTEEGVSTDTGGKGEEGQAAQASDETEQQDNSFSQRDLLVNPSDESVSYSLYFDNFKSEDTAQKAYAAFDLDETAYFLPFTLPTGEKRTLVLIGQYPRSELAQLKLEQFESLVDINLQVVKFPVKEETPQ